eukprot:5663245-Amphidinium_carterae.1
MASLVPGAGNCSFVYSLLSGTVIHSRNKSMHAKLDTDPIISVALGGAPYNDELNCGAQGAFAAKHLLDCLLYTSDAADDTPCVDLG